MESYRKSIKNRLKSIKYLYSVESLGERWYNYKLYLNLEMKEWK